MPHISLFLIWAFFALEVSALAVIPSTTADDKTPACKFTTSGLEFDLCPLLDSVKFPKISYSDGTIDTPPTRMNRTYEIDLKTGLKKDKTLPADLQCPEGTRICMIASFTRPKNPSAPAQILQVVPVATTPELKPKASVHKDSNGTFDFLSVQLHGASYANKTQYADFRFRCRRNSKEPSKPSFLLAWNGYHVFNWYTRFACPSVRATPPPTRSVPAPTPPPTHSHTPPAPTNPDDDAEDGDSEEATPVPNEPRYRWTFMTSFWLTLLILLLLRVLSYMKILNFRPILRFFTRRKTPYHSSSSLGGPTAPRLLRWAQQAGFTQEDADEELTSGEYSPVSGEEMPLTPTPRNGTFSPTVNKSYGT
ncbi:hypothetical protein K435DRAFT_879756 [Dendrothele bispora CBS 962.96]|uniref:Autophagy-related protein 27 n=1 Tax=Dendrothele bispora (strain CBS 962.96) TaxID=1314807 RepID=A0A4S8KLK1_DENBC|nr:hypothetical protein K435DRAFT_879756 [Dendrothele bispora CBS 962.96]